MKKKSAIEFEILVIIIIGIVILIFLIIFYFHIYNPINNTISKYNKTTNNNINSLSESSECYVIYPGQILEKYYGSTLYNYNCDIQGSCYYCKLNVSNKIVYTYINCSNKKIEDSCS